MKTTIAIATLALARPGTRNLTEVHVDAITGQVVATESETPAHEAAEAAVEKAKH